MSHTPPLLPSFQGRFSRRQGAQVHPESRVQHVHSGAHGGQTHLPEDPGVPESRRQLVQVSLRAACRLHVCQPRMSSVRVGPGVLMAGPGPVPPVLRGNKELDVFQTVSRHQICSSSYEPAVTFKKRFIFSCQQLVCMKLLE